VPSGKPLKNCKAAFRRYAAACCCRIPNNKRAASNAFLRWVRMAVRALRLRKSAAAIGVLAASPRMTVDQAVRDAVALCGPLLNVQEQGISLVRQCMRDYLLCEERDGNSV
jgi:hypothetical protein